MPTYTECDISSLDFFSFFCECRSRKKVSVSVPKIISLQKISVSVSKIFGQKKSLSNGLENFGLKKVLVFHIFQDRK